MSIEKTVNVARAVQVQIRAAEEAIDTALGEAAHLMETYITSRRALELSPARSTEVNENTLKAMQALNEAQGYMAEAHRGLTRIRKHIGVPAAMMPLDDSPKDGDKPKDDTSVSRLAAPLATT
ncbi:MULTISPECIES: hypothetical protein [Asticcacaulis]|uniref:hypothetical protein n=1 Tax=Asticcacaulis TaxID=76890 RepID=UPI001AE93414|nr:MULTISPECIES: hypothetical protein [Asticcacaulis]MBP2158167.1 hypothetical protein [Asticcacaulis solisilvae]MDR6799212.1 hypothetical protein [Asticcacaulis sp. BE141]